MRIPQSPGCILLPFDTAEGVCAACGKVLTGRQTRWCSDDCSQVYARNHYWTTARAITLQRDGYCCQKCGWESPLATQMKSGQGVFWSRASLTPQGGRNLEVNHIIPLVGAGYASSCSHHLSNLETLCHPCHVRVTRRQRINRARAA